MHETAVAQELFEVISSEAQKHDAKPVSATVSCGVLNAINDEIMQFAFDAIAKDTVCEGMLLKIDHRPLLGQCKICGEKFDAEKGSGVCPECGSEEFVLLPDEPIVLQEIEFSQE